MYQNINNNNIYVYILYTLLLLLSLMFNINLSVRVYLCASYESSVIVFNANTLYHFVLDLLQNARWSNDLIRSL